MGTSLSGLTPATTFDGLLKVGDNDPLTADLKAISTGDGTDTILSLSTGALQIGGATTIVGVDNDYNTVGFEIQRSDSQYIFRARNRGAIQMGSGIDWIEMNSNNNGIRLKTSNVERARITEIGLGIGETTPTSRLHVKGSGATSATTSLLVQNSAGSDLFKVQDNGHSQFYGIVNFRSGSQLMMQVNPGAGVIDFNPQNLTYDTRFRGDTTSNLIYVDASADKVGMNTNTPTAQLHLKGSGNDATTTALLVQNSDGGDLLTLTDDGALQINSDATERFTIANANGNAALNFRYNNIYTSGGNVLYISGASTIISGGGSERLRTSSTGTTIKGSGAINTTSALIVENSNGDVALNLRDGNTSYFPKSVAFGTSSPASSTRVHIQGSGATSATTALLVQNSAGTDLLKVLDDGNVLMSANKFQIQAGKTINYTPVGVGGASVDNSAVLQANSTTKGFLPPRMTTTERDAISTPAAGLMVYNTTTNKAQCYNGTAWQDLF